MIINKFMSKIKIKMKIARLGCVGKNCQIDDSVNFGSEPYLIFLGNNVKTSFGVKFINHDGGAYVLRNLKEENKDVDIIGTIIVQDNVFIGAESIIMPGITIGKNSIIGAGSIVTKSIPDNSVVGGVPARIISTIDQYEQKRKENFLHTKMMNIKEKEKYLKENIKLYPEKFLKR